MIKLALYLEFESVFIFEPHLSFEFNTKIYKTNCRKWFYLRFLVSLADPSGPDPCALLLTGLSALLLLITLPFSLLFCIKVTFSPPRWECDSPFLGSARVWEGCHLQVGQAQEGRDKGSYSLVMWSQHSSSSSMFQGPGIFFVLPCVDHFRSVDMRTVSFDVPPQEVNHSCTTLVYLLTSW